MLNPNQIKKIRELRAEGFSYAKIADRVGCSEPTVKRYVRMEAFPQKVAQQAPLPETPDLPTAPKDQPPAQDEQAHEQKDDNPPDNLSGVKLMKPEETLPIGHEKFIQQEPEEQAEPDEAEFVSSVTKEADIKSQIIPVQPEPDIRAEETVPIQLHEVIQNRSSQLSRSSPEQELLPELEFSPEVEPVESREAVVAVKGLPVTQKVFLTPKNLTMIQWFKSHPTYSKVWRGDLSDFINDSIEFFFTEGLRARMRIEIEEEVIA